MWKKKKKKEHVVVYINLQTCCLLNLSDPEDYSALSRGQSSLSNSLWIHQAFNFLFLRLLHALDPCALHSQNRTAFWSCGFSCMEQPACLTTCRLPSDEASGHPALIVKSQVCMNSIEGCGQVTLCEARRRDHGPKRKHNSTGSCM